MQEEEERLTVVVEKPGQVTAASMDRLRRNSEALWFHGSSRTTRTNPAN